MTRTARLQIAGSTLLVIAPLLVALAAVRRPTWYPVLDLAMTEYRVRDVFSAQSPLIGLPGRIGETLYEQGSHPGPLSFYLVAPVYRLLGATSWAMQVGTVVIHTAGVLVALVLAHRRRGPVLAAAVALLLAVLLRGYGATLLTQPWNPYLPVVWWIVLLLAVWSVLDGDLVALPIAVFAASLCAQTHVPYLALSLGLGAVTAVATVLALRATAARTAERRRGRRWLLVSVALGVVLWLPPVVDQLFRDPGNAAILLQHFGDPPEAAVGLGRGIVLTVQHLDLLDLVAADDGAFDVVTTGTTGPLAGGLVVLVAWLAAVVVAARRRHRSLLRLHAVVGAGLVLGALSISRIFGSQWWYLMLWAWGVGLLLALAVGWSAATLLPARLRPAVTGVLLVATAASSLLFAVDATDTEPPAPRLSTGLGQLLPDTVDALEDGVAGATGRTGTYVVAWDDAVHIGSQAYGLVNELERRGFRAGMTSGLRVPLTRYRVIDPDTATLEIHFASGANIERFRAAPGAVEVATADPRTPAERAEFDRLRDDLDGELRARGLDDVAGLLETDLFSASIAPELSTAMQQRVARLVEIGLPMAIFFAPAGTSL